MDVPHNCCHAGGMDLRVLDVKLHPVSDEFMSAAYVGELWLVASSAHFADSLAPRDADDSTDIQNPLKWMALRASRGEFRHWFDV